MKRNIIFIIFIFSLSLILKSCANMAQGPTGGLKDTTPPKYKESQPIPNSVNYTKNKIEITFDEYIVLDNPSKNLIISPPQDIPAIAKGIGKKVSIELKDSLLQNTTYTLDFGNSILDNNERNPLTDYVFSFSTGPIIDTMSISGNIINAKDLSPVSDIYVGVYSETEDSIFTSKKMERIAKIDGNGRFTIRNLAVKPYRIYALQDINNNYFFDQAIEGIAVLDEIITPKVEIRTISDTTYKDSITIDTIINKTVNYFLPDSLLLRFYNETINRQYYQKTERKEASKITLYFKNMTKELPVITPINFEERSNWIIAEPSVTKDTLLYWITDSLIYQQDTLQFAIDYKKTDSTGVLIPARDTVSAIYKEKRRKKEDKIIFSEPNVLPTTVEFYDKPRFEWKQPILSFEQENISLLVKEDTLWNNIDFSIKADTAINPRSYLILADMEPEKEYKMIMDSASITDIYGKHNKKIEIKIKIKSKEEYANLIFSIKKGPEKAFLELLNKNDEPVMQTSVIEGKGTFQFIKPGEYYVRLIADRNGNGKWDTGSFKDKIAPEEVFYFDKKLKLKANWDMEEEWDILQIPLIQQKPNELKKQSSKKN